MENKSFLKPYICPQCGGKVNRTSLVCEMCGTQFKEERSEDRVSRLVVTRPGVVTLGQTLRVDKFYLTHDPKKFSEYAIKMLAREFTECIAPYLDIKVEDNPRDSSYIMRARLRVVEPEYRFNGGDANDSE